MLNSVLPKFARSTTRCSSTQRLARKASGEGKPGPVREPPSRDRRRCQQPALQLEQLNLLIAAEPANRCFHRNAGNCCPCGCQGSSSHCGSVRHCSRRQNMGRGKMYPDLDACNKGSPQGSWKFPSTAETTQKKRKEKALIGCSSMIQYRRSSPACATKSLTGRRMLR